MSGKLKKPRFRRLVQSFDSVQEAISSIQSPHLMDPFVVARLLRQRQNAVKRPIQQDLTLHEIKLVLYASSPSLEWRRTTVRPQLPW